MQIQHVLADCEAAAQKRKRGEFSKLPEQESWMPTAKDEL